MRAVHGSVASKHRWRWRPLTPPHPFYTPAISRRTDSMSPTAMRRKMTGMPIRMRMRRMAILRTTNLCPAIRCHMSIARPPHRRAAEDQIGVAGVALLIAFIVWTRRKEGELQKLAEREIEGSVAEELGRAEDAT